jgi:alpha-glucosidase (family GH31 glycosyl hydrolase)
VPDGAWENAWTGEVVEGPVIVQVETPIDRIPVFIRSHAAPGLRAVFGR